MYNAFITEIPFIKRIHVINSVKKKSVKIAAKIVPKQFVGWLSFFTFQLALLASSRLSLVTSIYTDLLAAA